MGRVQGSGGFGGLEVRCKDPERDTQHPSHGSGAGVEGALGFLGLQLGCRSLLLRCASRDVKSNLL